MTHLAKRDADSRGYLIFITIISTTLLILAVSGSPQGISYDASWQMKALQQYLSGESPSLNHIVTPKPSDLTRDIARWLSDAPASLQFIVYPLIKNGIAPGDALRIVVSICIFIGSIGWVYWFSLFRLPAWIKIALATLLPWMRYLSDAFFLYTADILNYAITPWILLATFTFGEALARKEKSFFKKSLFCALFGFCLGCAYLVKYSLVFISLGAVVYLGLKIFRQINDSIKERIARFGSVAIFFVIPIAGLSLVNYKMSNYINLPLTGTGLDLQLQNFLRLLSNPALAVANVEAFFKYVLYHPGHGLVKHELWLVFVGFPGGLLLWWLLSRSKILKGHELLAVISLVASSVAIFILWILPYNISYQARHIAPASIAILPLLIQSAFVLWAATRHRMLRIVLLGAGIIYIAIPLISGVGSVTIKVFRTANYKVGPSHIYNPILAAENLADVRNRIMEKFSPGTDIWYFTWPVTALDFPGRAILSFAEFENADSLRQKKYKSVSSLRVYALLSPDFEKDGRGPSVRGSFTDAGEWEKKEIKGCNYTLWIATLRK